MNPHDDQPIDDVEIVDEAVDVIEATEIVEPMVIEPVRIEHHGFEPIADSCHAEPASHTPTTTDAEDFPRWYGYAFGSMLMFAGTICIAIGYGYTINHIPAPWFGFPVVALGIYFLIFPRSKLVRGAFENMRRGE